MEYLIILTCLILVAYILGFFKRTQNITFMNRDFTGAIKGIAILLVVWGHFGAHYGINHIQFIPAIGVSLFLILSGYCIHCSFNKIGIKNYWTKKIVGIFLPYYAIYLFIRFIENRIDNHIVINLLTFKDQWYLLFLLICYIIYFLSGKLREIYQWDYKRQLILMMVCFLIYFFVYGKFLYCEDMPTLQSIEILFIALLIKRLNLQL